MGKSEELPRWNLAGDNFSFLFESNDGCGIYVSDGFQSS
jgi:hypothetical protein